MRPHRWLSLVAAGIVLLAPLQGGAATLAQTLDSALELAQQGPRAQALRREGSAVREQAASLIAGDPALRVKHLSDRFNSNNGYIEWEAMLDLPLWLIGQKGARRAVADALGLHADALQKLLRWEMAGAVREAAWAAAIAHGRVRQAGQSLTSARALQADVAKRIDAGELARMDLLVAEQETLGAQMDLDEAQLAYDQAIRRYLLLTGQTHLPEPLVETVGATRALADDHPQLLLAEATVAAARAERGRTRSDRYGNPLLSLGGKSQRDDRAMDSYQALQIEINVPFALGSQHAPELAAAERALTDSEAARLQARREAASTLAEADLAFTGSAAALAVAERQQSTAARSLDLVRRAFELGEADLNTLVRARERARLADLHLEVKRLERGRSAARLNQALGVVPE